MATRFRLTSSTTAPAVSPALQSYTHSAPSTVRRQLLTSDSSALSTFAYAPDSSDDLVAGDSLLVQYVSAPMVAGIQFTNADTIKFAVQCLEANAGNNVALQVWAGIYSEDGTTLRRELRAKVSEGTEMATSLTNRFLSTTQGGATYTTVAGDRLVVEFSATGTPTAAGGTQGHNASIRLGGNGAGGDTGENDTDTGTTLNGWIEFTPTVTFVTNVTVTPDLLTTTLTLPAATVSIGETQEPAALGATFSLMDATVVISGGARRAIVTWAEVEIPSAGGNVTVTPGMLTATVSLPAPVVSIDDTVSVDQLALTTTLPDVVVSISETATPDLLTATLTLPDVVVSAQQNATFEAVALTLTTTLPAPTISVGGSVTVTPAELEATLSLHAPTVSASAVVSPSELTATFSLSAPVVSAGGSVTVQPAQFSASLALAAPTVSTVQNASIQAVTLALAVDLPAPTVTAATDVTVAPSQLALTTTLSAPAVRVDASAQPAVLVIAAAILDPTVVAERHATVQPALLGLSASLADPTVLIFVPGGLGLADAVVTAYAPADATVEAYEPAGALLEVA